MLYPITYTSISKKRTLAIVYFAFGILINKLDLLK